MASTEFDPNPRHVQVGEGETYRFSPDQPADVKPCAHGNGAFASKDFAAGETLQTFYTPFVDEIDPSHSWLVLKVGDKYWSEPTNPEYTWSNFLDHSDDPNVEFTNFDFESGRGDLVALRPIKAGEELLINYGQYNPSNLEDTIADVVDTQATHDIIQDVAPETSDYDLETLHLEEEIKKLEEEVGIHSEGRWDDPNRPSATPDTPRVTGMKQQYMELADQVGDDIMKLAEGQGYTPVEIDTLVDIQTQAKEAVMRDDLETAANLLHQLVELLEKKIPTL